MTTMTTTTTTAPEEIDAPPRHQLKVPDFTRSTIYQRHEARLAKSHALQDDPRPALIRILGGLPGFSKVILPYNNDHASVAVSSNSNSNNTIDTLDAPILETYSEETLFATSETRKSVGASRSSISGSSSPNSTTTTSATVKAMQAMLAAGVASGVAETLFGTPKVAKAASPFSNTTKTTTHHPKVTLHATTDGSVSLLWSKSSRSTLPSLSTAAIAATRPLFLMSVASTSVLFGSQTFFQSQWKDVNNNMNESPSNNNMIISTMLSSGVAGALVGGIQGVMAGIWQPLTPQRTAHPLHVLQSTSVRMPASLVQTMTHGSLSAIVLFTTFEQVQRLLGGVGVSPNGNSHTQSSSSSSSWRTTAGAGAIAGVASTLVTSHLSHNSTATTSSTIRLLPTTLVLRSAPKYAFFFTGYQQLRQAMCHQHRSAI